MFGRCSRCIKGKHRRYYQICLSFRHTRMASIQFYWARYHLELTVFSIRGACADGAQRGGRVVSSGWRWVEEVNIIHTNNFVSEVGGKFATFLPPRPARRPAARCAPLRNAPARDAVRHRMRANGREMWCRAKAVGRGRSRMIIDAPATLPDRRLSTPRAAGPRGGRRGPHG